MGEQSKVSIVLLGKTYKEKYWRWIVMGLIAIFYFANYMCYSILGTSQEQVVERLKIDNTKYNMIQSSYSFPNIINPFLAGLLIDKIGLRIGMIGYTTFMVIGMFLQYIAICEQLYGLMIAGMVCFGIGSEAMCIIVSAFTSSWFMGKELSLSLGVLTASANFGQVLANWIIPPLTNNTTIQNSYLVVSFAQVGGYVAVFIMTGIDYKAEIYEKFLRKDAYYKNKQNPIEQGLLVQNNNLESEISQDIQTEIQNEDHLFEKKKKTTTVKQDLMNINNSMFWLTNLIYSFECAATLPFQNNLQSVIINSFGRNNVEAGRIISIITLQTAIFTPIFALITDKIGRRSEILILSAIFQMGAFLLWMYIPTCPEGGCYDFYYPILTLGFSIALMGSVVYAIIPLVVDHNALGAAFGIQDCLQQIGMFLSPLAAGPLLTYGQKPGNDLYWFYFFFFGCGVVAFGFSILAYFVDRKTGQRLNKKEGEYSKQIRKSLIKRSVLSGLK